MKEFYDKPIYSITNYIIGFFLSSIYLAICNILLIVFFIFVALSPDNFNLFLLFICLIPLGPSLGALYSTIGKIIREKDIYFSSFFWHSYKKNFLSNLKLWLIELILIAIFFVDFKYFYVNMPQTGIHIIFALLIVISLIMGLYAFSINSRFELKLKDLLVLSLYYMIKKFPITILKIAVLTLGYYLLKSVTIIFLIFVPSIICAIFFYYDKNILLEIENRFKSSSQTNA
ncbi:MULTISPECIES: YesL family protein [unclassified Clostridium]|uniref:YesL family protein n=1 Tax=unclassified Clostridium TaxID=2614128 RepID=UPI000298409C|nr:MULTISPECIES: YesL family protein [unclassified Clostridium]EKQ50895.1 MAG: putative integral membrane protein [Clostridium sp. Maddingley MBC34-26]